MFLIILIKNINNRIETFFRFSNSLRSIQAKPYTLSHKAVLISYPTWFKYIFWRLLHVESLQMVDKIDNSKLKIYT